VPELFDVRKTVLQTGILLKPYLPIRYKLISYRPFGVREQYSHYTAPSDLFLQECADALREIGWTDILIL
jgi:pyruvate formate lyase activating enzyme